MSMACTKSFPEVQDVYILCGLSNTSQPSVQNTSNLYFCVQVLCKIGTYNLFRI